MQKLSGEEFFARAAVRRRLAFPVKMAEHDLVGEQRDPIERLRAVGRRAPDQFVLAVAMFDQPCGAKLLDNAAGVTWNDQMI